jgi:hypothetical protein
MGELLLISLFLKIENEEISIMDFFLKNHYCYYYFKNFFFLLTLIGRSTILIMCKSIDMNKRMTRY